MRTLLLTIIILITPLFLFAQSSSNYLQVSVLNAINFQFNTPAELETMQTVSNAIRIRIRTRSDAYRVYVDISDYNAPNGYYPTSSPLAVKWSSDTSPTATNVATSPVYIDGYDRLLFRQPQMSTTPAYYDFIYHVQIDPVGYEFPVDNYTFTLLFTMVQD
jgi:uncharacterized protein YaiE (UPF0345 family)